MGGSTDGSSALVDQPMTTDSSRAARTARPGGRGAGGKTGTDDSAEGRRREQGEHGLVSDSLPKGLGEHDSNANHEHNGDEDAVGGDRQWTQVETGQGGRRRSPLATPT